MLHTTFHLTTFSKPAIKPTCMSSPITWRTLLDKGGRADWNKPVSYSSAWSDSTNTLYSLDDYYPGKQQKIAYFKNSSVLFYPGVITEHSRHSFWRGEYNSCLLPSAAQFRIYLSPSHTEQTAQKCSRQNLKVLTIRNYRWKSKQGVGLRLSSQLAI